MSFVYIILSIMQFTKIEKNELNKDLRLFSDIKYKSQQ